MRYTPVMMSATSATLVRAYPRCRAPLAPNLPTLPLASWVFSARSCTDAAWSRSLASHSLAPQPASRRPFPSMPSGWNLASPLSQAPLCTCAGKEVARPGAWVWVYLLGQMIPSRRSFGPACWLTLLSLLPYGRVAAAPSCGLCDAERQAPFASDQTDTRWTNPDDANGWRMPQYSIQSPQAYRDDYAERRKGCTWVRSGGLMNHITKYGSPALRAMTRNELARLVPLQLGKLSEFFDLPVSVCEQKPVWQSDGSFRQTMITRLGPVRLRGGWFRATYLPARPRGQHSLLVATIDAYYNALNGSELGYPPLHPHHSNSIITGYPRQYTSGGRGEFADWYPWSGLTLDDAAIGGQSSMNSPGFNADLMDCEEARDGGAAPNACYYLQLPKGYGWPVSAETDFWSSTLLNSVAGWTDPPIYVEYGRTYDVIPRPESPPQPLPAMRPVWTLDFPVIGSGGTFTDQAIEKAAAKAVCAKEGDTCKCNGTVIYSGNGLEHIAKDVDREIVCSNEAFGGDPTFNSPKYCYCVGTRRSAEDAVSVAWHTFQMPAAGRFVASWYHTHAQAASELWVLDGDVHNMLPKRLVDICYGRRHCTWTGPSSRGTGHRCGDDGLTVPQRRKLCNQMRGQNIPNDLKDVWLGDPALNISASDVRNSVLRHGDGAALRCQFKSRNSLSQRGPFVGVHGREAARARASESTCDGWEFAAGQNISVLAFNYPTVRLGNRHDQHARWFVVTALDIAKWDCSFAPWMC